jgi:hypothetical protein
MAKYCLFMYLVQRDARHQNVQLPEEVDLKAAVSYFSGDSTSVAGIVSPFIVCNLYTYSEWFMLTFLVAFGRS